MRRTTWIVTAVVVAVLAAFVVTGVTDAFGTGAQLRANLGGTLPDGAANDTFWDANLVDIPGLSITAVHCHGRVQFELQALATGPIRDNACYAAMGAYKGEESSWGVYVLIPGNRAVYRLSNDFGSWRYCIGDLVGGNLPPGPVGPPCGG